MNKEAIFSILLLFFSFFCLDATGCGKDEPGAWLHIDRGLSVGKFKVEERGSSDPEITVIKVSPESFSLVLLCASELKEKNMTVKQWCQKYNLIGGINAGMFQEDYKSNVGFMKNFFHINNPRISPLYKSLLAFNPLVEGKPYFRIFDTDENNAEEIIRSYGTVVQNLRLIKRPAENRWNKRQDKKWCEAALAEDKAGNALFIYCNKPYSMHEFNTLLLDLPLDVVCAQHLEGGSLASLYFSYGGVTIEYMGGCTTDFAGKVSKRSYWAIPNVLGFKKR